MGGLLEGQRVCCPPPPPHLPSSYAYVYRFHAFHVKFWNRRFICGRWLLNAAAALSDGDYFCPGGHNPSSRHIGVITSCTCRINVDATSRSCRIDVDGTFTLRQCDVMCLRGLNLVREYIAWCGVHAVQMSRFIARWFRQFLLLCLKCHRGYVRYIIHQSCLAVQASFYSDAVECSTLHRRVPGSILGRGMEIF